MKTEQEIREAIKRANNHRNEAVSKVHDYLEKGLNKAASNYYDDALRLSCQIGTLKWVLGELPKDIVSNLDKG